MDDYRLGLNRYVIQISCTSEFKKEGERLFRSDNYGKGYVSVFKVLEGNTPSISTDIRHLVNVGDFELKGEENKSIEAFMNEIKDELVKLISKDK